VRPTLVFGKEDILVNNIAWLMRKSPLFPIFGSGGYRVQPVFVEDLAQIAVRQAAAEAGTTVDAIGPETYTFQELLECMRAKLRLRTRLVQVPPGLGVLAGKVISLFLRDVLLTRDELKGLMDEMLTSAQAPNGTASFSAWLEANRETVGMVYSSEVKRHFHWKAG
jgi:nucleoside-diphosphate-sugar epimerase